MSQPPSVHDQMLMDRNHVLCTVYDKQYLKSFRLNKKKNIFFFKKIKVGKRLKAVNFRVPVVEKSSTNYSWFRAYKQIEIVERQKIPVQFELVT